MGLAVHTVYQEYHLFSKPAMSKTEKLYMLIYKLTKQTLQGLDEEEVELAVRTQTKDLTQGLSETYKTAIIRKEGNNHQIVRHDLKEIPEEIRGELEAALEEQVPEGIRNLLAL